MLILGLKGLILFMYQQRPVEFHDSMESTPKERKFVVTI